MQDFKASMQPPMIGVTGNAVNQQALVDSDAEEEYKMRQQELMRDKKVKDNMRMREKERKL